MTVAATLPLCFLLGCVCGLRSMTAPALVCWGVHLGWLSVAGTPLAFLSYPAVLILFTVFAAGELIADKFPGIPSRISPGPLVARIVFGAVAGWVLALSGHASVAFGVAAGAIGGIVGSYAGFSLRRSLTRPGRLPDLVVALMEDLVAVGGGVLIVSRF